MLKNKEFTITIYKPGESTGKRFVCGLNGFFADVSVQTGGYPAKEICNAVIYGVSLETITQYSFLTFFINETDNRNQIEVTVDGSLLFKGELEESYGDFSAFPNLALRLKGVGGYYAANYITPSWEITEEMNLSLEQVFRKLSNDVGFTFFNHGVEGDCPHIVLAGSGLAKIYQLADAVGITVNVSDDIVTIYPKNGSLLESIAIVNSEFGMIGYPSPISGGIKFSTLYNPLIRLGQRVKVETIVPLLSGVWVVRSINTNLSTRPGGDWNQEVGCHVFNE